MILVLGSPKFLLWKRGVKHTKNLPRETEKKKKAPDHIRRGNSNVLAGGLFIRVLKVVYA